MSSWEGFATEKQAALTVRALTKIACPAAAEDGTTAFVSVSWTDYLGWDEVIEPPKRCERGRSGLGSSSGKGAWPYATCATFCGDGESAFEHIAPLSRRAGVTRCGLPTWCCANSRALRKDQIMCGESARVLRIRFNVKDCSQID